MNACTDGQTTQKHNASRKTRHKKVNRRLGAINFLSPVISKWRALRPVSRRISRQPKKIFGLAAVNFAKPPAAGRKKIRLSRRLSRQLSRAALTYKS